MPSKKYASGAPGDASPCLAARAAPSRVEYPAGGVTSFWTSFHSTPRLRRNTCTAPALLSDIGAPDQQVVAVAGERGAEARRPPTLSGEQPARRRPGGALTAVADDRPGQAVRQRRADQRLRRRRAAPRRPARGSAPRRAGAGGLPRSSFASGPARKTNALPGFHRVESKVQAPGAPTAPAARRRPARRRTSRWPRCRSPGSLLGTSIGCALAPPEDDHRALLPFTTRAPRPAAPPPLRATAAPNRSAVGAAGGREPRPLGPRPPEPRSYTYTAPPPSAPGAPTASRLPSAASARPEAVAQPPSLGPASLTRATRSRISAKDVDRSGMARRDRKSDQGPGPADQDLVARYRGGAAEADGSRGCARGRSGRSGNGSERDGGTRVR